MTAFNRDRYLPAAIESVMGQTDQDWRLVIVDDGSTDRTRAIAQSYAQQDDRLTVISQANHGCGHALHRGLGIVAQDCKYVGWVDSDDVLHPQAIARCRAYLDADRLADCVYTHYQTINADGVVGGLGRRCQISYCPDRLLREFMVFHFRMLRSVAYREIGGVDPDLRIAVDYDLILRFSERFEIMCLPEVLYSYRTHAANLSNQYRIEQAQTARDAASRALQRRRIAV